MIVFLASFLTTSLLVSTLGADTSAYLWLLLARIAFAELAIVAPITKHGRYKPLCIAASLIVFALSLVSKPKVLVVLVLFLGLCALIDVCLDGVSLEQRLSQPRATQIFLLTFPRIAGLFTGLLIQDEYRVIAGLQLDSQGIQSFLLIICCLFLTGSTPGQAETSKSDVKRLRSASSALNLFCAYSPIFLISVLATHFAPSPYPLAFLTRRSLLLWVTQPNHLLLSLFLSLIVIDLFQRIKQPLQALISTLCFLVGLLGAIMHRLETSLFLEISLSAIAFANILILVDLALCRTLFLKPPLRLTLPLTIWCLGGVIGESTDRLDTANASLLEALGVALLMLAFFLLYHFGQLGVRSEQPSQKKPPRLADRHGDKVLDFVNVAMTSPRRRSHLARDIWQYVMIRIPVFFIIAILYSSLISGSWYAFSQRAEWRQRVLNYVNTAETELFLSSIRRRLEEEMLASKRIPQNWDAFIQTSFQAPTTKLKAQDFWKNPLLFEVSRQTVLIRSAGVDGQYFTADDIIKQAYRPDGVEQ